MAYPDFQHSALDRFLRYVTIDTQSDPHSPSQPSTEKQKNLSRLLVSELSEMGIQDAELDEHGYVYATVPSTVSHEVPVLCFCSHVDTSPDAPGSPVVPIVHEDYQGQMISLPDNPSIIIDPEDHPDLKDQIGNDIITASGNTLLGADNKAGLAAIMDAVQYWMRNPGVPHGKIRILFTPDEEIGRGVNAVNINKLGADIGYTVDGEKRGSLEDETFSADGASLTFTGVGAHPGFAKDTMQNALKIAGVFLASLPVDLAPEGTEGREGFVHPVEVKGIAEEVTISLIIRDFDTAKLEEHGKVVQMLARRAVEQFPGSSFRYTQSEQYRNMKEVINQHPNIVRYAEMAMLDEGIAPIRGSIRGGTDGSRLSFMGLPTANIFAGEHAFHSRYEWVSRQDMEMAAKVIVGIARHWAKGS